MKTILIVEDNAINQELLARRLKKRNYQILIANDGEQALQLITANKPHLILLDMNIPKIDGWEVAKICKSQTTTQKIPIIALTAHAMPGDRDKTLAAGCDDYQSKPLEFDELLKKIEKLAI